jgi:Rrf2 family protein
MQITRQADYAIRAVRYLARQGTQENIAKRKAAKMEKVSTSKVARKKNVASPEVEEVEKELNVPTSEIAKAMKIPPSFLAKIISQLVIARLVQTSRGASGGVILARDPKDISVLDVVEAIDGHILLNECVGTNKPCDFEGDCLVHPIWLEVQESLVSKLRATRFDALYR